MTNIYSRTLSLMGAEHNIDKTIEEASELITELIREKHGRSGDAEVVEELADLWICMEIMRLQLVDRFDAALDRKLTRLSKRLDERESKK